MTAQAPKKRNEQTTAVSPRAAAETAGVAWWRAPGASFREAARAFDGWLDTVELRLMRDAGAIRTWAARLAARARGGAPASPYERVLRRSFSKATLRRLDVRALQALAPSPFGEALDPAPSASERAGRSLFAELLGPLGLVVGIAAILVALALVRAGWPEIPVRSPPQNGQIKPAPVKPPVKPLPSPPTAN
jgi:hypothetical protein